MFRYGREVTRVGKTRVRGWLCAFGMDQSVNLECVGPGSEVVWRRRIPCCGTLGRYLRVRPLPSRGEGGGLFERWVVGCVVGGRGGWGSWCRFSWGWM